MSDQQLIDEVVGYLTKDGAVMDLSRARQGAKLIRRQHARIEADEALMQTALEALEDSIDVVRSNYMSDWRHGLVTRKAQLEGIKAELSKHENIIDTLIVRLAQEHSNAS